MKYDNECFDKLIELIESNPNDWQSILKQKPYSLKNIKQSFYNPNWYMVVYNLFESDLLNPVVKACRGTVVDTSNPKNVKIICAPYLKFCNLGEFPEEDKKIDWKSVWFSEKIDGILIKAFKYDGVFYWTSNGSFDLSSTLSSFSDVFSEKETDNCKTYFDLLKYAINKIGKCTFKAIEGNDQEKSIITYNGWCDNFPNGSTLCLELISPKNKIICDYPKTELYWHGYRDGSLVEIQPSVFKQFNWFKDNMNIKIPQVFDLKGTPSAESIRAFTDSFDGSEHEGVVICDKNWHRAKIKSKDYLKLKFLRDSVNLSEKNIYNYILSDEIDDVINEGNRDKVNKVKERINLFCLMYQELVSCALKLYNSVNNNRKIFAELAKERFGGLTHLAFNAIDNVSSENVIKRSYFNYNKFDKDFYKLKAFLNFKSVGEN